MAVSFVAPDPRWCTGHYEPSAREAFHQHTFDRTWGDFDEKIRLGLVRFDHDGRPGSERIEIQYLTDVTDLQGSVSLQDDQASNLAGQVICTLALKKSASGGGLALFGRCFYEAGRAFMAALSTARASSRRTASSQRRSIRSM